MMYVMRNRKANVRSAAKDATHERIVAVAARAIRRSGYDGTGVADIMKEAGLTHGAFYSHFASREAMLASEWYRERLETKRRRDIALWRRHETALQVAPRGRLAVSHEARQRLVRDQLARLNSPDYLNELVGTLGADPFHLQR